MKLAATKRSAIGKGVDALRKGGSIPAIIYGAKEVPTPITVSAREFGKVYQEAGESSIVSLTVDSEEKNVLIYEVDLDPISNLPRHVDFYAVQKGQKVEVKVPIEFTGDAPAVKELGANLIKVLHEVEVEAEATNIPHEITVDVSVLTALDQSIALKDLKLPEGVTIKANLDEVVALIAAAVEEPTEPVAAPDMSTIEISEERGKKEEEAVEGGSAPSEKA